MIKSLLYSSVFIFALVACNQQPGKTYYIDDTLKVKPTVENAKSDSVVQLEPGPAITSLPFGPKAGPKKLFKNDTCDFYRAVIGEGFKAGKGFKKLSPVYPLPPIEKYIYTIVDTVYDPRTCSNDKPLDSVFRVNSYQVRLPDHEKFEVYYMSDITGINEANKHLTPGFTGRCDNFELSFYGVLIYYQRTTKTARLLPVFYNYYGESEHERRFYIDSNYRITLGEEIYSEGDYESKHPVDVTRGGSYKVMMKNGVFEVKKCGE